VVAISRNIIGSCAWDQTARIWHISDDLREGVCLHVLVHTCGLTAIAWNGLTGSNGLSGSNGFNGLSGSTGSSGSNGLDGRLFVGGFDGMVRVWDMDLVARPVARLQGHRLCVSSIVVMANGIIATGSYDGHIRLWDHRYECIQILGGHRGYVLGLVVLDDQRIGSCSADATIRVWDTAPRMGKKHGRVYDISCDIQDQMTRGKRAPPIVIYTPHTQWICCIGTIDGMVVSGSDDASVCRFV